MSGSGRAAGLELLFGVPAIRSRNALTGPLHSIFHPSLAPLRWSDAAIVVIDTRLKTTAWADFVRRTAITRARGLVLSRISTSGAGVRHISGEVTAIRRVGAR